MSHFHSAFLSDKTCSSCGSNNATRKGSKWWGFGVLFLLPATLVCVNVNSVESEFVNENLKHIAQINSRKFLVNENHEKLLSPIRILQANQTEEEDHDHEDDEGHDHEEHDEDHEHDLDEHDEDHDEDHDEHDEDHDHDHDEHDEHDHDEHDEDHDEHDHDEHDHEDHDDHDHASLNDTSNLTKPWGAVIGGTLLVNLCTLIGVITLAPSIFKTSIGRKGNVEKFKRRLFDIAMPSFAAGSLLATACLLILPEALVLIQEGVFARNGVEHDHGVHRRFLEEDHHDHEHDEAEELEGTINTRFGISLIMGFFLPLLIRILFPSYDKNSGRSSVEGKSGVSTKDDTISEVVENAVVVGESEENENSSDAENQVVDLTDMKVPIDYNLLASIVLGDGLHNFGDGIFIGIAFLLCSNKTAIAIMISTIYHELVQELADYFLLTEHAGLKPLHALIFNFISGLTVMLGGLVILFFTLSWDTVGSILAISGGVYFFISAFECIPRVESGVESVKDRLLSLFCAGIGALPIGLVLLDHEHCGH